jgi:hypothetical protein
MSTPAQALTTEDIQAELQARVARYLAMDVPVHQIAMACGLREEHVKQLAEQPVVQIERAKQETQRLDQADLMNRGWDSVEEEALGTVVQHLRANPDPDFALRAASVANKAVRRNGNGVPVLNGTTTATATIQLSVQFIEKLQQMQVGMEALQQAAKRVDMLPWTEAEKLLTGFQLDHNPKKPITL